MISEMGLGGGTGGDALPLGQLAKELVGEQNGQVAEAGLREKIASHDIKGKAFTLTMKRAMEEAKAGASIDATSSMFKYYGTEHNKNRFEMTLKVLGNQGLGWEGDGFTDKELKATRQWLRSKGNSIEGGTSEVQLNVIAKRVLGLPD